MIQIDDLIILIFFIWIFYDTYKNSSISNAVQLVIFILTLSFSIVLIPLLFGDTGKIIMYFIVGVIGVFFHFKKNRSK